MGAVRVDEKGNELGGARDTANYLLDITIVRKYLIIIIFMIFSNNRFAYNYMRVVFASVRRPTSWMSG